MPRPARQDGPHRTLTFDGLPQAECQNLGILVFRSGLLPRFLGVWLIFGGLAWILLSLTGLALLQYYERIYRFTEPIRLGEVAFLLWLIIMGAKERAMQRRYW